MRWSLFLPLLCVLIPSIGVLHPAKASAAETFLEERCDNVERMVGESAEYWIGLLNGMAIGTIILIGSAESECESRATSKLEPSLTQSDCESMHRILDGLNSDQIVDISPKQFKHLVLAECARDGKQKFFDAVGRVLVKRMVSAD